MGDGDTRTQGEGYRAMNDLRCAWCSRVIGTTTADGGSDGICPLCGADFLRDNRIESPEGWRKIRQQWREIVGRLMAANRADCGAASRTPGARGGHEMKCSVCGKNLPISTSNTTSMIAAAVTLSIAAAKIGWRIDGDLGYCPEHIKQNDVSLESMAAERAKWRAKAAR